MIKDKAIETLKIEAAVIENLIPRIDEEFIAAVKKIMECRERVVVKGMGKSGHVGRKIRQLFLQRARRHFSCTLPKLITAIWEC